MLRVVYFTHDSPKGKGRQDSWEIFPSERVAMHIDGDIHDGPEKKKLLLSEWND